MEKNPEDQHLGDVLRCEFMEPRGLSPEALAQKTGLSVDCINAVMNGTQRITPEIDAPLSRFFGLSDGFWFGMQNTFEAMEAERRACAKWWRAFVPILRSAAFRSIDNVVRTLSYLFPGRT